jgi:hypothetical protein
VVGTPLAVSFEVENVGDRCQVYMYMPYMSPVTEHTFFCGYCRCRRTVRLNVDFSSRVSPAARVRSMEACRGFFSLFPRSSCIGFEIKTVIRGVEEERTSAAATCNGDGAVGIGDVLVDR